ncbi:MAG: NAD-dependent epimerase/dehydratase family protein [Thalassospira sp.]|jgi:UDP-glucuronate 4-epimerase|nr:NAD-dependent epimerase/dehydratase family protein [Thalassospira sp.]
MRVVITGAAGFIGFHCVRTLLARGDVSAVIGIDNLNDYYDPALKAARLKEINAQPNSDRFHFHQVDIADAPAISRIWQDSSPSHVIHLAAQAGVRYAAEAPFAYTHSNITGFLSILEACRLAPVEHLLYASSSSIYGLNTELPFTETQKTDQPASLYGATKKANELMAASYAHLYNMPATGLRFFTVYGEWGRPDMAFFKFVAAMRSGQAIGVYNRGQMTRDFTYVDDVVSSVLALLDKPSPQTPPHRVFNVGGNQPMLLLDAIKTLESVTGVEAVKIFLPIQPGDVEATAADPAALKAVIGRIPETPLKKGLERFVAWYDRYHQAR